MPQGPTLPPHPQDYGAPPGAGLRLPAAWSQPPPPAPPPGHPAPPAMGRGFAPGDIFRGLGLTAVVFFITFLIGFGVFALIDDDPTENAEFVATAIIVFIVDLLALILVPLFVLRGRGAARLLGLRAPSMSALGWGMAALVAAWIVVVAYQVLVDALDIEVLKPVSAIDGEESFTVLAAVLIGVAVLLMAPLAEEIFHRGFLVGAIARRWGPAAAVVISAAIFSALHFDVGSLIPFFIVGVAFALAYLKSRNLWASISAHFIFNLVAFAVTVSERGVS